MGKDEVTDIVGYTKLGFHKCECGQDVVREHEACRELLFLQSGVLKATKCSDNHNYTLIERIEAPLLIEPDRLFGLYQHYARSYTTLSESHLITIDKADVLKLCADHNLFLVNYLGLLSTSAQRQKDKMWHNRPENIEQSIVRYFADRVSTLKGEKTAMIKMQTLATAIGESRLNVSKVLNSWNNDGLIRISRGCIHIPAFERLLPLK